MRNIIISLFILVGLFCYCFAGVIPQPPTSKEIPTIERQYIKTIYDNLNKFEIVTTNPDGTKKGKKGDAVVLQTGGNSYLEVNTDSSTTWLGVQLTNTP